MKKEPGWYIVNDDICFLLKNFNTRSNFFILAYCYEVFDTTGRYTKESQKNIGMGYMDDGKGKIIFPRIFNPREFFAAKKITIAEVGEFFPEYYNELILERLI